LVVERGGDNVKEKIFVAVAILTFCLAIACLAIIVNSQPWLPYDPWLDVNDDGQINILDLKLMRLAYGGAGVPLNKTEILLNLTDRVEALEPNLTISGTQAQAGGSFSTSSGNATVEVIINYTIRNSGQKIEYLTGYLFIYYPNGTFMRWDVMNSGPAWLLPGQEFTEINNHILVKEDTPSFIVSVWTYDGDRVDAYFALS